MIHQVSVQLGHLPISAVFLSTGQVGFQLHANIPVTIDQGASGETLAILSSEEITIANGDSFVYNVAHTLTEGLREWLTLQCMEYPL